MHFTATRTATLVVALALATPYLFASPAREQGTGDEVLVVATTSIVGDIVARIGGDRISLYVMLPPGADPHLFQPTPRDARHVADAAVVFANGVGLEADFLGDLIASAAPRRMVELSEHLPLRRMDAKDEEHDAAPGGRDVRNEHDENGDHDEDDNHDEEEQARAHHHGEFDAHVWMDPTMVAGWAAEVAEVLAEVDPEYAAEYARRAAELAAELHELDAWIHTQTAAVPRDRRVIVTDHDVLAYFAGRYGFELLDSVSPGFSTASEPSARHLAELREVIAEHAVPAIFVGTTANPQVAQSVADDLGIEVVTIYTGSLSEPDGPAGTYQDFIRTNVTRIVAALGGP